MSKTYFSTNLKPFGTIESQLPKDHVETIMQNSGYIGTKMNNNIEGNFPNQTMALISKEMTAPEYIKCSDGKNDFYFYKIGINNVEASKDGEFFYRWAYKFDEYMSVFGKKLQLVLEANINVQFARKFYDRFIYEIDDAGYLLNGTIDFFKQIQYLKAPSDNVALVREFIYGSNADLIYQKQNYEPLPESITFTAGDGSGNSVSIDPAILAVPNLNKRYLYLILKSSAKIASNAKDGTRSDNNKIIVPLITGQEDVIIDRLFNFDITKEYPCMLDVAGENIVGFYESQTPPTLIVGAFLAGEPVQLLCAFNGDSYKNPIGFFQVPHNYAFKFNLLNSDDAANGISAKLKYIIRNSVNTGDVNTEPLFLSDNFYKEIHQIDTNNRLETSMSLVTLTVDGGTFSQSGINISCYDFFDNTEMMIYTYSLNKKDFGTATNTLNTSWNSNQSNRITALSLSSGLYDSSSANYYSSNSTTQYTSIQNRKSEETQSGVDYGLDTAKSTISAAAGFDITHPGKSAANVATTAISIAEGAVNNAMSNQRANLSLASSIQNIKSSPSSSVSSPYVSVCVPSTTEADGSYLFNTYAHRISDFDSWRIFIDLSTNGYSTNETSPISTFENRIFYNVLNLSTSICFNVLGKLLQDAPASIGNSQIYNSRFIEGLNRPHGIYRLNKIENYFDPGASNYKANIELKLPPLPDEKIDINTLIDVVELGLFTNLSDDASFYTDDQRGTAMMQNNTRITAAGLTYADFDFTFTKNTDKESLIFATVKLTNEKGTGTITFYYQMPNLSIQVNETKYTPLYVADSQMNPSARLRLISNLIFQGYFFDKNTVTLKLTTLEQVPRSVDLHNVSFSDNGIEFDNAVTSLTTIQTLFFKLEYTMNFTDKFGIKKDLLINNPEKMKYAGIYLQATNFNDGNPSLNFVIGNFYNVNRQDGELKTQDLFRQKIATLNIKYQDKMHYEVANRTGITAYNPAVATYHFNQDDPNITVTYYDDFQAVLDQYSDSLQTDIRTGNPVMYLILSYSIRDVDNIIIQNSHIALNSTGTFDGIAEPNKLLLKK